MRKNSVSVFKVCILFLVIFGLVATLATVQVAAQNVSGTWTSTIPGQGAVTDIGPYTIYDDVSLVLTQTGNGVSGRITLTKDHVEKNDPGWPDYSEPMDTSETLDVTGTVNGNIFSLSIPAVSGLTLVCTITNDRMQGSDSYLGATSETNHDHRFDLQERWY